MKSLSSLSLKTEYRTGVGNLVEDFYSPCLENSSRYDRAVGYFRSSVFAVAAPAIIPFAKRGGSIRIVCSPDITDQDNQTIENAYVDREKLIGQSIGTEIDTILNTPEIGDTAVILATLIKLGFLEIKVAYRPQDFGFFHEKLGLFSDEDGLSVSFKGSSNETFSAWSAKGNHESFEVFREWVDSNEQKRVIGHRNYFELLWLGNVPGVETVDFPEHCRRKLETLSVSSLNDIEVLNSKKGKLLFPHQSAAIAAWNALGRKGIFEHATGSGKTFSAISIINEHIGVGKPALVVVPSTLLLDQWKNEIQAEVENATILMVGGGHTKWRKSNRVESFTSSNSELGKRIILGTIQSASKPEFLQRVENGEHLLIVCDEVHRAGSREFSSLFTLECGSRLGLSATPRRYGDPDGTTLIMDYFHGVVPPPFSLFDAIQAERLVPYEYYPHFVRLNRIETLQWAEMTNKISLGFRMLDDGDRNSGRLSDRLLKLLIKRSRIAKKAASKIELAAKVLNEHYADGDHWLIYCEDRQQMNEVTANLKTNNLPVWEYHSAMEGAKDKTLDWFDRNGGIIVSIKCLDEGVDIPNTSHALILASSRNPREFIQRRGRVLRIAPDKPGKRVAIIHDALVIPDSLADEDTQTSLTHGEISRAYEFANWSTNRIAAIGIKEIAIRYGINLDDSLEVGVDED